eukprot:300208-Rhodomonas_salina.1
MAVALSTPLPACGIVCRPQGLTVVYCHRCCWYCTYGIDSKIVGPRLWIRAWPDVTFYYRETHPTLEHDPHCNRLCSLVCLPRSSRVNSTKRTAAMAAAGGNDYKKSSSCPNFPSGDPKHYPTFKINYAAYQAAGIPNENDPKYREAQHKNFCILSHTVKHHMQAAILQQQTSPCWNMPANTRCHAVCRWSLEGITHSQVGPELCFNS